MKKSVLMFAFAMLATMLCTHAATGNITIIVSLDGFRWDYAEAFNAPFMKYMADNGVKAVMQPSFPSKTFPNHYTLATGLRPDHHGIVANEFRDRATGALFTLKDAATRTDPKYYGGDPVWLTARNQGLKVATVYWVGSDVAVKGSHPNYWEDYQKRPLLTLEQRVAKIISYLKMPANKRPNLIMAYFEEPDASGHRFGPISATTRKSFEHVDSLLQNLWQRISKLPIAGKVNLIVTGDHGMAWLDSARAVPVKRYLKDEWVSEVLGSLPAFVNVRRPEYADSVVNALSKVDHVRAWKRQDVPAYLDYGTNPNVGDVVVLPDVGWLFTDAPIKPGTGNHGFDNTACDMQVGFRAIGADFKHGYTKPGEFRNVSIYPLLCHLLGITPSPNDGDLTEVTDLLQ